MRFISRLSTAGTLAEAFEELTRGLEELPRIDLLLLFYTAPWVRFCGALAGQLRERYAPRALLGVSGESVVGGDREIEEGPAVSLLAGYLPGVELQPFHIRPEEWRELLPDDERLQQRVGAGPDHRGQVLLADPFTSPVDALLPRLDELFGTPTYGGMASASRRPGGNRLLLDGEVLESGAVGLGIGGPVELASVVSQGCRPIGEPMVVTRAEEGLVQELGRRPALEAAEGLLRRLSPGERDLLANGLFVGVVINEYQDSFGRGDFLVRGVLGADHSSGALALGDDVRAGQTVQFHVRDAATAHEDLTELLRDQATGAAAGGLLFSCNGRGSRMFPEPHHDAGAVRAAFPELPLAGFFAMGELGPIGGRSFLHGHTASLLLFRSPAPGGGAAVQPERER